jgi:hypothetical protein
VPSNGSGRNPLGQELIDVQTGFLEALKTVYHVSFQYQIIALANANIEPHFIKFAQPGHMFSKPEGAVFDIAK